MEVQTASLDPIVTLEMGVVAFFAALLCQNQVPLGNIFLRNVSQDQKADISCSFDIPAYTHFLPV